MFSSKEIQIGLFDLLSLSKKMMCCGLDDGELPSNKGEHSECISQNVDHRRRGTESIYSIVKHCSIIFGGMRK
jgi:hypothetical protein